VQSLTNFINFDFQLSNLIAEQLVTNMLGVPKTAPKIGPVGRSSLLGKVKQFLPEMQEANRRLTEAPCPEDLDIEKISQQHKDNYIEFVS
jgi:hypothetical protein